MPDFLVPFNHPTVSALEEKAVIEALRSQALSGNGRFTQLCSSWLKENTGCHAALLTTSCTSSLEMAAILAGIEQGDEIIMPSYTFVSTANAFVLRGARIAFVDVHPSTMNLDERLIEQAVTPKTRAIVVVHYAGVACRMDAILQLAREKNLMVIEDAAQAVGASWEGRSLGTFGALGAYSFHDTKNITSGEGGALLVNQHSLAERAQIIWEKGTDRSRMLRGLVDKYTWVDIGSSYLPSELTAALLHAQFQRFGQIQSDRLRTWEFYRDALQPLQREGKIQLAAIPDKCQHNAHMFFLKVRDLEERRRFLSFLRERGIQAVFHYIPLHSSPAGLRFGSFRGEDRHTTQESERLVRLPLYYGMTMEQKSRVAATVSGFFGKAIP